MPQTRYGRAKELVDIAKAWFADRRFEILDPVGLNPGIPPRQEHSHTPRQTEAEFRVYQEGMSAPKHVVVMVGNSQARNLKLATWLKLQGDTSFFAIDECGAILYIEGCDQCGGAKKTEFQGFIAPKICGHYGGLVVPVQPKASFLSAMSILDQVYYVLETGTEAQSVYDFTRGRHTVLYNEDGSVSYLFSAKHVARHLNLDSSQVRQHLKQAGSKPESLRRFGKLSRLWGLPQRPPDKRSGWDQVQEEPSLDLGEDEDFWNTGNKE